ncbi:MAG TPA: adenine-specific DNA-methyltransferase, partial [Gammaproteobacteria bacterium]|nr:adenine-specific DNA-methyltransferase [Gammaproteobacteria bacterium]
MKIFQNELTTLIYGEAIKALNEYIDDNSVHLI